MTKPPCSLELKPPIPIRLYEMLREGPSAVCVSLSALSWGTGGWGGRGLCLGAEKTRSQCLDRLDNQKMLENGDDLAKEQFRCDRRPPQAHERLASPASSRSPRTRSVTG